MAALPEFYTIEDRMSENMYKGIWINSGIRRDVTIRVCENKEVAIGVLKDCRQFESNPNYVHAYTRKPYNGCPTKWVVLLEPLDLLDDDGLKKFFSNNKPCWTTRGLGNGAKMLFRALGQVLLAVHEKRKFSNNFLGLDGEQQDGIWLSKNFKIKICNLKCTDQYFNAQQDYLDRDSWIFNGLREDLNMFKRFIDWVVSRIEPIVRPSFPQFPQRDQRGLVAATELYNGIQHSELGAFQNLYRGIEHLGIGDSVWLKKLAGFIYKAPLFWEADKQEYFFELVNRVIPANTRLFEQKFAQLRGWKKYIETSGHTYMIKVLNHEKNSDQLYEHNYTLVRFIHNLENHYNSQGVRNDDKKIKLDVYREVAEMFPYLCGYFYRIIFLGMRGLIMHDQKGPASRRGKLISDYLEECLAKFDGPTKIKWSLTL